MKVLTLHDNEGNISAVVVGPSDSPARTGLTAESGQHLTEVEVAGVTTDLTNQRNLQRLLAIAGRFRVEAKAEGKLVYKRLFKRKKK